MVKTPGNIKSLWDQKHFFTLLTIFAVLVDMEGDF
jgi:hypothetical protein